MDGIRVDWEREQPAGQALGTARLDSRQQPFVLSIHGRDERLFVRCVSLVGTLEKGRPTKPLRDEVVERGGRIAFWPGRQPGSRIVTVEDDVLLAAPNHDEVRVGAMVRRVVERADELERLLLPDRDSGVKELLEAREEHARAGHERERHG